MTKQQYAIYKEMMKLIAKYDWAREGMPDPYDTGLDREVASEIRDNLVKLTGEMCKEEG